MPCVPHSKRGRGAVSRTRDLLDTRGKGPGRPPPQLHNWNHRPRRGRVHTERHAWTPAILLACATALGTQRKRDVDLMGLPSSGQSICRPVEPKPPPQGPVSCAPDSCSGKGINMPMSSSQYIKSADKSITKVSVQQRELSFSPSSLPLPRGLP
uniref:Uncharacterized protein n=1 Tax=Rousettus aegyptiacus TaxID=9407 RepID=A0A7J8BTM2_ROUAE|nr:hypothetical protein HJG63_009667 [Rousettus aegyptiacus]